MEREFYEKYEDLNIDGFGVYDIRILIAMSLFIFAAAILFPGVLYPRMVYKRAQARTESAEYDSAISDYTAIITFKDSAEKLKENRYSLALECFIKGSYREAAGRFLALGDYMDSRARYLESVYYLIAEEALSGKTEEALSKLSILIDANYFRYTPLTEPDKERAAGLVKASSVNLYAKIPPPSEWEYYTGSACVYEVAPDYVSFLSARHVLDVFGKNPIELTFYDGTTISSSPEVFAPADGEGDLALFRIRTEEIPIGTLLSLKEINFREEYYGELKEGDGAFLYAAHFYQKEDLISDTEFLGFEAGKLTDGYYDSEHYLAFKRTSENGQSGCPVFDLRGRCIAVASGYYFRKKGEEVIFEADCYLRLSADLKKLMSNPI